MIAHMLEGNVRSLLPLYINGGTIAPPELLVVESLLYTLLLTPIK